MRRYFKTNIDYFNFYNKYKETIFIERIYYTKIKKPLILKQRICVIYNNL